MRIAIVAPGGVGGYFGGLLAKSGESVAALARGAHLAAIRANGLRVEGPRGDDTVRLDASDDAAALGVADIVLFAVKLYQIEAAARAAAPCSARKPSPSPCSTGLTAPKARRASWTERPCWAASRGSPR